MKGGRIYLCHLGRTSLSVCVFLVVIYFLYEGIFILKDEYLLFCELWLFNRVSFNTTENTITTFIFFLHFREKKKLKREERAMTIRNK